MLNILIDMTQFAVLIGALWWQYKIHVFCEKMQRWANQETRSIREMRDYVTALSEKKEIDFQVLSDRLDALEDKLRA